MIKKIITCGCSFSEANISWVYDLETSLKEINPNIEFLHLGLGSQGNELIQKKVSLALIESLEKYTADEIAVFVMWSGTERKAFYINNVEKIQEIIYHWKKNNEYWGLQFFDLKNNLSKTEVYYNKDGLPTHYDPDGGWYNTNFLYPCTGLTKEYFESTVDNLHAVHTTIENIIMLQNFCKLHEIHLFQQFYRSYVLQDIENNKNHQIINYLYKQLDKKSFISEIGIYEYLSNHTVEVPLKHRWNFACFTTKIKPIYFCDDFHPNRLGHKKWTDEVIIEHLKKEQFLEKCIK